MTLPISFFRRHDDGHGGLFPSYVEWCKSAGFFALSRNRFLQKELRRAAPRVNWGGMRRANLEKTQVLRVFRFAC